MKITKLSEHIGAEVTGIDLTQPVDEETRRGLNQAVVDNIALVIRDQKFTPQQFLAAGKLFGEPMDRDHLDYSIPGVPFVHEVSSRHRSKDGSSQEGRRRAGTPTTPTTNTRRSTPCLYAVELPAKGGGTSVANMRAGYAALPDELKQRIDGMKTANVIVGSAVEVRQHRPAWSGSSDANPDADPAAAGADQSGQRQQGALLPSQQDREHRRHDPGGHRRTCSTNC